MLQPRGRPSLTQDPGLVTNSNLLSREEPTLFPISARVRNPAPQRRQADDSSDSPVTRVVQTVSIVQYVNPDGSPRGISTHYAQPQTVLADPVTGDIIGPADDASGDVGAFDTPETPEAANSPVPDGSNVPDAPQSSDDLDTSDTQTPDDPEPSETPLPTVPTSVPESSEVPESLESPEPSETPISAIPVPVPESSEVPESLESPKPSETPLPAVPVPIPESSKVPESLESPEPSEVAASTSINLTPSADPALDLSSILPSESPAPSTNGTPDPSGILILPPDTSLDDILPSTTFEPSSSFPTLEPSQISAGGFGNSTTRSSISSTSSENASSTTLLSSSFASDTTAESTSLVSPTTYSSPGGGGSNGGGNGGGEGGVGGPEVDSAASDDDDGSTPTGVVVGGVVGGVAGAALLIFLLMALFRWRRQKAGRVRLEDGHGAGSRGLGPGAGGSGGGGDGGGGMTQRSFASVAPAMLAGMASRRKTHSSAGGDSSPPTGETGFYRVSGKKLPSVIQHGGDGYTDPRFSTISGASSGITDSHGLEAGPGGVPRLAVGQPMRPISGVPMIRSSPARTPMEEHNPFSDPLPSPPAAPGRLHPDAVGRTLSSQDTSRASSSKFTEVL